MAEKKRWQAKEWIFLVWFLIAFMQINYSIYITFFAQIGSFFFWNGMCMFIEGVVGAIFVYAE
jgi:hypothetical protein